MASQKEEQSDDEAKFDIPFTLKQIGILRGRVFEQPLSKKTLGKFDLNVDEYQLEERNVSTIEQKDPAGHIVRVITMTETFNNVSKNAIPKQPTYTLDAALALTEAKVQDEPPESKELLISFAMSAIAYSPSKDTILRILQAQQYFETEESARNKSLSKKILDVTKGQIPGLN